MPPLRGRVPDPMHLVSEPGILVRNESSSWKIRLSVVVVIVVVVVVFSSSSSSSSSQSDDELSLQNVDKHMSEQSWWSKASPNHPPSGAN